MLSWYHANLKRDEAEDMLKRVRKNGAFLVRRKEADQPTSELCAESGSQSDESYAISFRSGFVETSLCSLCWRLIILDPVYESLPKTFRFLL